MSARRDRYRSARRAVLAAGLLVGIGYPLALSLGGAVLVQVHSGPRGASLLVHNARPWLIVAAVAAVLLVLDWITPGTRGSRRAPAAPAARSGPVPAPSPPRGPSTDSSLQARLDDLQAARRSEREFNAALDAQLARRWRVRASVADRQALAEAVLALSMELVDASMGLLVLGHDVRGAVAALGIGDPGELVAQLADGVARGRRRTWRDPAGGEWLVLELPGDPGGYIALGGRDGGFTGLDEEALTAVGERAGALLADAPEEGPAPPRA